MWPVGIDRTECTNMC